MSDSMKTLVVYDSMYGNTERIAKALSGSKTARANVASVGDLKDVDILFIGTPTHGGRPTPDVQTFIDSNPDADLKRLRIALFDTRNEGRFVKVFGYAADRMAESLTSKGANIVPPPKAFFVKGRKGPLVEGELEKAAEWAKEIIGS